MDQDQLKRLVAEAARDEVLRLPHGQLLGIGTGSTANWFIDLLAPHKNHFSGVVSSSMASTNLLLKYGFTVIDANKVISLPVYVDGADEIDPNGHMIKGGGGALTREKIIASLAKQFVCICDSSKQVLELGAFPLPIEVVPLAEASVARMMEKFGGTAKLRLKNNKLPKQEKLSEPFVTDNSGWILDVSGLHIHDPVKLENEINQIPGIITVGIFAQRKADVLLVGGSSGVTRLTF